MKTNNCVQGRYFAEIVKEVVSGLEENKYQMAEFRVSIYGRSPREWEDLAAWFVDHDMASDTVAWLIQVPRLFHVYRRAGQVPSFGRFLEHVFLPLFLATADPAAYPKLATFLESVVGFDSVDDESKPELQAHTIHNPLPHAWTAGANPSYSYYMYYMYANISVLNQVRRGMRREGRRCGVAHSLPALSFGNRAG